MVGEVPDGQDWDVAAKVCKERPKCAGDMVGTPPNCACPDGTEAMESSTRCRKCLAGRVTINGKCACPKGAGIYQGKCQRCPGDYVPVKGACDCPSGTINFPDNSDNCAKGNRIVCQWRGTAPGCDGSCEAGEEYLGAGPGDTWSGSGPVPGGFGSSCWSGSKAYCCRPAM